MYGLGRQQRLKVKHLRKVAICGFALIAIAVLLLETAMNINVMEGAPPIGAGGAHGSGDVGTTPQPQAATVNNSKRFESLSGKGVLSNLGPHRNLRRLLHKRSDLCGACGVANDHKQPSFCSIDEADPFQTAPIEWELNRKPRNAEHEVPKKPTLVYIAVGGTLHGVAEGVKGGRQDYVEESIRQWRLFNPASESHVILVVSSNYKDDTIVASWAKKYTVELIFESDIERTAERETYRKVFYIQGYMHPGGSRKDGNKDFNKLVMERFHILHSVIRMRKLRHVLHLENDIMVYQNWASYLPYIINCGANLASTFASPKGVIPGVVYVRDEGALTKMLKFVNDLLVCGSTCVGVTSADACHGPYCHWTKEGAESYKGNCQPKFGYALNKRLKMGTYANDMTYLMNYWQYYGSADLAPLPAWDHGKGENCIYEQSGKQIFDLASFGQWYSFSPPDRDPPKPDKQYVQAMKVCYIFPKKGKREKRHPE